MRKYLAAVLSVLMLVMFAGAAFAAEAEKAKPEASEHPCAQNKNCGMEGISKVKGTFKSMDKKKGELVVTGSDGKDITYKIEGLKAKNFKAGDKVEVTCMKKGEDCYAKKIRKLKESRAKKL